MKGKFISYDYLKSIERIDEIITSSDNSFEEVNEIPSIDELTFTNGYYVNCSAMFVDIRDSSELPRKHTRPKLAKLYRAYISEVIAIMLGNPDCAEAFIVGDCVAGIFNSPYQSNINRVFSTAAQISSLMDIMNYRFKQHGISEITIGIGLSYGRALMIKAGFKGSSINDIVWMGDVVNEASKLASYGNETYSDREIIVSDIFYSNLNDDNKKLLTRNYSRNCYHGNVVYKIMNDWYKEHCK